MSEFKFGLRMTNDKIYTKNEFNAIILSVIRVFGYGFAVDGLFCCGFVLNSAVARDGCVLR